MYVCKHFCDAGNVVRTYRSGVGRSMCRRRDSAFERDQPARTEPARRYDAAEEADQWIDTPHCQASHQSQVSRFITPAVASFHGFTKLS